MDVEELAKLPPSSAPTYSSQVKIIFSVVSVVLVKPLILAFAATTEAVVFVIRVLILSEESVMVTPDVKLSDIKFSEVKASNIARLVNASAVTAELVKELEKFRLVVTVAPESLNAWAKALWFASSVAELIVPDNS